MNLQVFTAHYVLQVEMKGKGKMVTYWLLREEESMRNMEDVKISEIE